MKGRPRDVSSAMAAAAAVATRRLRRGPISHVPRPRRHNDPLGCFSLLAPPSCFLLPFLCTFFLIHSFQPFLHPSIYFSSGSIPSSLFTLSMKTFLVCFGVHFIPFFLCTTFFLSLSSLLTFKIVLSSSSLYYSAPDSFLPSPLPLFLYLLR